MSFRYQHLLNFAALTAIAFFICQRTAATAETVDVKQLSDVIKQVGPKGAGHEQAIAALRALSKADGTQIPQMLASLDGADILAANWLRPAIESVVDHHSNVPWQKIREFLGEPDHSQFGRRLAYELLVAHDPKLVDELLPNMLDDTSLENRRDAVDWYLKQVASIDKTAQKSQAIEAYQKGLDKARAVDQIESIVKTLAEMGVKVDITQRLGFLVEWNLIGPFDNTGQQGFDVAYAPEKKIDLNETLLGKEGKVSWSKAKTDKEFGIVDLAELQDKFKGAITYAYRDFISDKDQPAEIRLGCINANKVWLNGELVISNNVYHAGMDVDQYIASVNLKKGKNAILVKVCQNEQDENWAQRWQFQLRVCDATGKAVYSQDSGKNNL